MLIASLLGNRQGPPLLPPPASPAEDDSDFLAVVSGQHSTSSGQPAAPELEAPLLLPAPSSPSPPQEKEPPPLICQGLPSAREVMTTVAALALLELQGPFIIHSVVSLPSFSADPYSS